MHKYMIPSSPNWQFNDILSCATDRTLVYGTRNNLVIIRPGPDGKLNQIDTCENVSKKKISAVAIHNKWNKEQQLVAVGDVDGGVKLWDLKTQKCTWFYKCHNTAIIGLSFKNDEIIAGSEDGNVSKCCILTKQSKTWKLRKDQFTCFAICPYQTNIVAFGSARGYVCLYSTKGKGKILQSFRAHDSAVHAVSFCPVEKSHDERNIKMAAVEIVSNSDAGELRVNVLDEPVKDIGKSSEEIPDLIVDKIDEKIPNENVMPKKNKAKVNPWINLKFPDDDEIVEEPPRDLNVSTNDNFLDECKNLLVQIKKRDSDEEEINDDVSVDGEACAIETAESDKLTSLNFKRKILTPRRKLIKDERFHESGPCDRTQYDYLDDSYLNDICDDGTKTNTSNEQDDDQEEVVAKSVDNTEKLKNNCEIDVAEEGRDKNQEFIEVSEGVSNLKLDDSESSQFVGCTSLVPSTEGSHEGSSQPMEVPKKTAQYQKLLFVTSCTSSVTIWKRVNDQACVSKSTKTVSKRYYSRNPRQQPKTTVAWIAEKSILVAHDGLSKWDFNDGGLSTYLPIHIENTSAFSVSLAVPNNVDGKIDHVWYITPSKWLLCFSLSDIGTVIKSYPTLNGFVYKIDASPIDPNRMALACGDQTIRLFDATRISADNSNMNIVYRGIRGKVHTVCWHPKNEFRLAYATSEGCVGLINCGNVSKGATKFKTMFTGAVYVIVWGPLIGRSDLKTSDLDMLYVCHDNCCVVYDSNKPDGQPTELVIPNITKISELSWSPDYQLLAVACKSGAIAIVKPDLTVIAQLFDHTKTIYNVAWHPFYESHGSMTFKYWLASGGKSEQVFVHDLSGLLEGKSEATVTMKFSKHIQAVTGVCWSPLNDSLLATSSMDGFVMVIDVLTEQVMSSFCSKDQIFTTIWSAEDEKTLISGGHQSHLFIWNMDDNPPVLPTRPPVAVNAPARCNETKSKQASTLTLAKSGNDLIQTCRFLNVDKHVKHFDGVEEAAVVAKLFLKNKGGNSGRDNSDKADCYREVQNIHKELESQLVQLKCPNNTTFNHSFEDVVENCATIFSNDSEAVENIVRCEAQKMEENPLSNWNTYAHLLLLQDEHVKLVEMALQNKIVNPWVITVAASVSDEYYRKACKAYADQLKNNEKFSQAASYYLICFQFDDAIDALCEAKLFTDALILCHVKTSDNIAVTDNVVKKLKEYAVESGKVGLQAICQMYSCDFKEASQSLTKQRDPFSLRIAKELAKFTENIALVKRIDDLLMNVANKMNDGENGEQNCVNNLRNEDEHSSSNLLNLPMKADLIAQPSISTVDVPETVENGDDCG